MGIEIRQLAAAELNLVAGLARAIWPAAYAGVLSYAQIENILSHIYSPANLAAEMAGGHRFWAAFDGASALGFSSGYRDGAVVWLKKLYVLPQTQGRGIGRALLETVAVAFAPADEMRLLVNSGNAAAQDFYRRVGFTKTEEIPVRMGDYDFTDYVFARPFTRP